MTRENVKQIPLDTFKTQLTQLPTQAEQTLFAFLYMTGCRISEALKVKTMDLDPHKLIVNIRTLKNKATPYREVILYPQIVDLLHMLLAHHATKKPTDKLWDMTRQRAWKLSTRYFYATDHSFRHTNAIYCASIVKMNAPELCTRFGWAKFESARSYLNYNFQETMAAKMNLKTPAELGIIGSAQTTGPTMTPEPPPATTTHIPPVIQKVVATPQPTIIPLPGPVSIKPVLLAAPTAQNTPDNTLPFQILLRQLRTQTSAPPDKA